MHWIFVIALLAPNHRTEFEAQLIAELASRAPAAVEPFRRADREREAGNLAASANAYNEVIAVIPDFDHAHRRLCQVRSELGRQTAALQACRRAIELNESADNFATLAMVLVNAGRSKTSSATGDAMRAARRAVELGPDSVSAHTVLCHVSAMAEDIDALRVCSTRLALLAPDDLLAHTFAAILAIAERRWHDARDSLERAKIAGMSTSTYDELDATIRAGEPAWKSLLRRWWWLAAGVLLLGIGVAIWMRRSNP